MFDREEFDQNKGKMILGIIAVIVIAIFLILVIYFAVSNRTKNSLDNPYEKEEVITTTKNLAFDVNKITEHKIYNEYNIECIEVYYGNKKIDLGIDSSIPIYAIRDISYLQDIAIFNVAFGNDGMMLVIINSNGDVINSYTGKNTISKVGKKLKGGMYKGEYSIKDNKIYITSDEGGQDSSLICEASHKEPAQYIEVITYEDNKLSDIKLSSTINAKEYIKDNEIYCKD